MTFYETVKNKLKNVEYGEIGHFTGLYYNKEGGRAVS